ncbi:MAG: glycerol-3-phosphate 1-O-acyltransferase PlsY [Oscillospiraceae bacterium]|nr:glycerol-3-phosphate 1-O-acyltransferase PlsY [Oscillospiraceae bacterium]
MIVKYAAILIGAYLLGSMSLSILVSGALFGKDIRTQGSGNAGATNMARVFGWGAGLLTLAGDAAKAVVCMLVGKALAGDVGLALAGMACIFGHCYPVFHDFKGGKGVSVGGVIAFGIDWRVGLCVVGVFLLGALLSKKVSLGSILGAITVTAASVAFGLSAPKIVLAAFSMALCIWRHRGNIQRLLAGTEPDFKAHKKEKTE